MERGLSVTQKKSRDAISPFLDKRQKRRRRKADKGEQADRKELKGRERGG